MNTTTTETNHEYHDTFTGVCRAGQIRASVELCGGVWTSFRRIPGDTDNDVRSLAHGSREEARAWVRGYLASAAR